MKNNNTLIPFERQEIIRRERHLAKYANTMDCLFCIPFTKQGLASMLFFRSFLLSVTLPAYY